MGKNQSSGKATVPFIVSVLGVSEEELYAQGLDAQELADIYNDHSSRVAELEAIAAFISNALLKVEGVHAVKYRIKEPSHLLQKLLRKKQEYPDREFTKQTYLHFINDLVGVRALHLYKTQWVNTSNYVQQLWDLKRLPYAYLQQDTEEKQLQEFETQGCRVILHPKGYSAVHLVVATKPGRQQYFAEIQLRTLFEEAWSEIDHNLRYPDHNANDLLKHLLRLLNQLTTDAGEVATQIQAIATELQHYKNKPKADLTKLHSHIARLPVNNAEKETLYSCLARLTNSQL